MHFNCFTRFEGDLSELYQVYNYLLLAQIRNISQEF